MVLGLVFHSNAITSFKVIPDRYSRMYHIILHIISIFCITFSFYISWTFVSIQEISKVKNGHLSTIHAWIGFMTFICYLLQLTVGYLVFVIFQYFQNKFPFLSEVKAWLYSKHKYFGVVCWLFAILSLVTGIMERQEIYHYLQLREPLSPTAYMYANALVLSFLAMFGCVMYILFYTKQDQLHEENSYDPVGSVI
jgi:cytochrome b561